MRPILLSILMFLVFGCNNAQDDPKNYSTVIRNVSIIDVEKGEVISNQNIIIESTKIIDIVDSGKDDVKAETVVDGTGKYLIPGLAEMHAHIPPPSTDRQRLEDVLFLYISNGITTIRGMLGHSMHLELRDQALKNEFLSPRIYTSSPSLNGNSVTSLEQADSLVKTYKQDGYDFLKIHPGIKRDVFDQLVKTANEVGIEFAGHVPVEVGIRHALISKYASIDHVDGYLEGLVPESKIVDPNNNGFFGYNFTNLADPNNIDELVSLTKENEVWIVPTQSLFTRWFAPITADELLSQPEMQYMPKETLDNWRRVKDNYMQDEDFNETQWQRFDSIRKVLMKKLQDGGHGMLLGSDAPQLFNVPGFSIHHEIDGMQEAGLSNLEIIQSGTINPAIFFEMEDGFGQIKEGLSADFILLDGNPLEDLDALKRISGVMLRGKWLPKLEIESKLNEVSQRAKAE